MTTNAMNDEDIDGGPRAPATHAEIDRLAAALAEARRVLEDERLSDGTKMYLALARGLINRILEADANCDPPQDIALRLESIIRERDRLRSEAGEAQEREGETR